MYKKLIIWFGVLVLVYFLITVVFLFSFDKEVSKEYISSHSLSRFYSDTIGPDRAVLVDLPRESSIVRVNMIEHAKKSIDISYYSMESGQVTSTFWALLFEAADRGVRVRIILDGVANGVKTKQKEIMYAIKNHPNIELKFYEVPNVVKPWTLNNRLHDKYIIVDQSIAAIGGRNIGDRFMAPNGYKGEITYDRDVVIFNNKNENSVIHDLSQYFKQIYDSPYSVDSLNKLSLQEKKQAVGKTKQLQALLEKERNRKENIFNKTIDWQAETLPTNKITLIHNPINRFNKEPWVWFEINRVIYSAKKSVFIQSPYIVPAKKMMNGFFPNVAKQGVDITVLTNSRGSTPNYPAFSVYLNERDKIVDSGAAVYEYQGEHSIHTKAYSIDDDLSLLGSFNMDPRSAFLSTETMMVIHSKQVHKQLESITDVYLQKSLLIGEDYEYMMDANSIEERSSSRMKNILLYVVGFFGRFVSFLL
ncbi:phospholipase D-like domain-containing protein [Bacillus massiliigorillae]|uniref:phospholipase D-like domain-containing protein n=1 Tax=Bacillus massiliigorillae TaxID=1243664 RepID=UPI0003A69198|nr:phospholipase D family protein [Bacillus massiliigorillae]